MTRQRTKGYVWNQHFTELQNAHTAILKALQAIARHPDMSRAWRAEQLTEAALALSNAQEQVAQLKEIAGQTHDELTTLESKLQVVK